MRFALLAVFAMSCCVASVAFVLAEDKPQPAQTTLVAAKAKGAVEWKAELTDAWKDAAALEVEAHEGKQNGAKVTLRALYDDTHIYLLASWADATKSETKGAWIYKDGKWANLKGDEDRIAFAFNVSSASFDKEGCAGLCHSQYEGKLKCQKEGEVVDLWHWKAARGGQNGWADDQKIDFEKRGDDKGKSAYAKNEVKGDTSRPGFVWKEKADKTGAFDEANTMAIPADYKPAEGESLPANVIRKPEGSRGDIEAVSRYADGRWWVLLKRKLSTGNADDAEFKAAKKTSFALAVFDDTGASKGNEHALSGKFEIELK